MISLQLDMSKLNQVKLFAESLVGMNALDEEDLMLMVQLENRMAFECLYKRLKSGVYNYLLWMTKRNRPLSADILQTTFLKVYECRHQYKKGHRVRAWIWAIAKNTLFDYAKKKDALHFLTQQKVKQDQGSRLKDIDEFPDSTEGVLERLVRETDRKHLAECIEQLPPKQLEVVSLRVFSELSYREMEQNSEFSLSGLKTLYHRAKKNLMECMRQKNEG
jgi:RNA polymerase sigma-70 factor (ECF subfamily)